MVFIVIGAVKAAKAAKLEMAKGKKRNAAIVPVDGSSDMMADRGEGVGEDTWFGSARPKNCAASSAETEQPVAHNAVGCWSRAQNVPSQGFQGSSMGTSEVEEVRTSRQVIMDAAAAASADDQSSKPWADTVEKPPTELELPPVVPEISPAPKKAASRPPRKPRCAEGSFAACLLEERTNPGPSREEKGDGESGRAAGKAVKSKDNGSFDSAMKKNPLLRTGATVRPAAIERVKDGKLSGTVLTTEGKFVRNGRTEVEGRKPSAKEKVIVGGSFAAAMRSEAGETRIAKAKPLTPAAGSFANAMRASGEKKGTVEAKGASETKRVRESLVGPADGSFQSAMLANGALRHAQSMPVRIPADASKFSQPVGSMARRGGRGGALGVPESAERRDAVVPTGSWGADPQSSMSAEGSMKRRVTRRY